jgi:transposase
MLLPHLAALRIGQVLVNETSVLVEAEVAAVSATCPDCGSSSRRVHSRYRRTVADLGIGGRQTLLRLRTRRFFCDERACERRTFAEQVAGVTGPYARRTGLLRTLLERLALALGGRPGARMAHRMAAAVSRTTLLHLIRALPLPEPGQIAAAVGVDDFAFRKGAHYGSIVVDVRTHRPVDLLPDRRAASFATGISAPRPRSRRAGPEAGERGRCW